MLVTCICPTTASRAQWLPLAIECFRSQTYEDRELLIVCDEGEPFQRLDYEGLRLCIRAIAAPAGIPLGAKRNFACEKANGEIIAHFDDDDYSAPGRLTDQVARLLETGLAVTGYSRMKFTDGKGWWQYRGIPDYVLGTSLCFRKAWWHNNRFPAIKLASDHFFMSSAVAQGQLAGVPALDMMGARHHGGNLNERHFENDAWLKLGSEEAIPEMLAC